MSRAGYVPPAAIDGVWNPVVLINGWAQSGPVAPAWMRDSRGLVHWRGKVTGVAAPGSAICTGLPATAQLGFGFTNFFNWQLVPHASAMDSGGTNGPICGQAAAHVVGDVADLGVIHYPAK